MSNTYCGMCGYDKDVTRKIYENWICDDCLITVGVESIRAEHQQAQPIARSSGLFHGLTPSAIRAAVAENGAGTMEVSPALILALLDAAEAGRELRETITILSQSHWSIHVLKEGYKWRANSRMNTDSESLAQCLINLARPDRSLP